MTETVGDGAGPDAEVPRSDSPPAAVSPAKQTTVTASAPPSSTGRLRGTLPHTRPADGASRSRKTGRVSVGIESSSSSALRMRVSASRTTDSGTRSTGSLRRSP
ncbi:hypothetical protein HEP84_57370 [Streptomyces sp. RLB1-33]